MKKLFTLVLIIGGIGLGAWWLGSRVLMTPEQRACGRLASLCSGDQQPDEAQCAEGMEKLRKTMGDVAFDRATSCLDKATNCMAAMGCVAGSGLRGVGEFFKGLMEGLGGDLQRKSKEMMEQLRR